MFAIPTVTIVWLLSLALCAAGNAYATSRMGEAEVRMDRGQVCFSPTAAELRRPGAADLRAGVVTNMTAKPVSEVRAFKVAPEAMPISLADGACLPHGSNVQVSQQTGPVGLAPGNVYQVLLLPKLSDRSDPARGFTAEFCLFRSPDQALRVHQVRWDEKAGKWQRDVCFEK
jgi:hypothetical protein